MYFDRTPYKSFLCFSLFIIEHDQLEKGLVKFESIYHGVKWGTSQQVEVWKKEYEYFRQLVARERL